MLVQITRDRNGWYSLWTTRSKPSKDDYGYWKTSNRHTKLDTFCARLFQRVSGVRLPRRGGPILKEVVFRDPPSPKVARGRKQRPGASGRQRRRPT